MSSESESTPSEPTWYLLGEALTPTGPFPSSEIQQRIREGHLRPTDLIGRDGMRTWQLAFTAEGLLPVPWKAPEPIVAQPPAAGSGVNLAGSLPRLGNIGPVPAGLLVKLRALHEVGTLPTPHYRFLIDLLEGRVQSDSGSAVNVASTSSKRNSGQLSETGFKSGKAQRQQSRQLNEDEEIFDASPVALLNGDEVLDGIDLGFDPTFKPSDDERDASNGMEDEDDDLDEDLDAELNVDLEEALNVDLEVEGGSVADIGGSSFDFGAVSNRSSGGDDREKGKRSGGDDRDRDRDRDRGRRN